jgi:hypothetical protein
VAVEASIEVDEEVVVAEGLAVALKLADFELVVRSINHADRLAAAAAATGAANLVMLRAVEPEIEHLERVVENGGTIETKQLTALRVPSLLSVTPVKSLKATLGFKGSIARRLKQTLENVRGDFDAAVAEVMERARIQVVGADYDESEDAFAAALRGAETKAEKLAIIVARGRKLYASSVTATLSSDSPVRVLSENFSGVLSQNRIGVLTTALSALDIRNVSVGTRLERLDSIIKIVEGKLAEEPAGDRALASVNRHRSCLSEVNPSLEAELFARFAAAWQPFASAPGHGPVGHVPFDAAERDRLRAVVKSYQGKPTNPIGHVRFGVPLEPGLLPGLNPPRGSAYLRPVDALSRLSIEELAASLAHGEKIHPHLYVK